jgi:hypothetical protein
MYLHASPMRLVEAEAAVAGLDSLGTAAALQRNQAHKLLMAEALRRFDVERMGREGVTLISLCSQLSQADRQDDLNEGYCHEREAAMVIFYAELYKDTHGVIERLEQRLKGAKYPEWDYFRKVLREAQLDWLLAHVGQPVPPLLAQHWVGEKGSVRAWPVPGKTSVYIRGGLIAGTTDGGLQDLAMWQRLGKKYGDKLNITILHTAAGSFRDGPPLTPEEEAGRVGKFYREELGLPVTVAVEEPPITKFPPPDGRVFREKPESRKDPYYEKDFLLADRQGKLVLTLRLNMPEPMIDAWIARTIAR